MTLAAFLKAELRAEHALVSEELRRTPPGARRDALEARIEAIDEEWAELTGLWPLWV